MGDESLKAKSLTKHQEQPAPMEDPRLPLRTLQDGCHKRQRPRRERRTMISILDPLRNSPTSNTNSKTITPTATHRNQHPPNNKMQAIRTVQRHQRQIPRSTTLSRTHPTQTPRSTNLTSQDPTSRSPQIWELRYRLLEVRIEIDKISRAAFNSSRPSIKV